jgi:hypothetical protein
LYYHRAYCNVHLNEEHSEGGEHSNKKVAPVSDFEKSTIILPLLDRIKKGYELTLQGLQLGAALAPLSLRNISVIPKGISNLIGLNISPFLEKFKKDNKNEQHAQKEHNKEENHTQESHEESLHHQSSDHHEQTVSEMFPDIAHDHMQAGESHESVSHSVNNDELGHLTPSVTPNVSHEVEHGHGSEHIAPGG